MEALIAAGRVIELAAERFDVHPSLTWANAPDGTLVGDLWDGTAFSRPTPPTLPAMPVYVPLSLIRERVTAAGHWEAFAAAVDGLPAAKRWHLLTLEQGIAPDDPDATGLLMAIGCNPAVILAAPGS